MAAVRLGRGRRVCGGKNKLRCKRHDDERQFARESKAEDFEHFTFAFNCKMSFREIRDALLLSYDSGLIDDEEFLLLYEEYTSTNLEFCYYSYPRFNLESTDEAECKANFRVEKADLPFLAEALGIPPQFTCNQGTVCDGMEGLCVLLKKYAYPCRCSDMIPIFGRSVPELCMITSKVTDWVYENRGHRLTEWNDTVLSAAALRRYADACSGQERGGTYKLFWFC